MCNMVFGHVREQRNLLLNKVIWCSDSHVLVLEHTRRRSGGEGGDLRSSYCAGTDPPRRARAAARLNGFVMKVTRYVHGYACMFALQHLWVLCAFYVKGAGVLHRSSLTDVRSRSWF